MTNERPTLNMKKRRAGKSLSKRPPNLKLNNNFLEKTFSVPSPLPSHNTSNFETIENSHQTHFSTPSNLNRRHSLAITKITEIIKNKLYLGNESDANNYSTIKSSGITAIITLNATELNSDVINLLSSRNGSWKHIPIRDRSTEQIIDIMDVLVEFIEKQETVLVHCQHGISRSSTIVMAYLMKALNMTNGEAFDLVKAKRPIVDPNFGFLTQLLRFEEILNSELEYRVELPYSPKMERHASFKFEPGLSSPIPLGRRILNSFNFMEF